MIVEKEIALHSKLPHVGTSIFSVMSQLATEHKAINLSQGFPDFECDAELIALVNSYMKKGFNQYAPMPGVPALREQIAAKTERLYQMAYHPETEVTVTSGATQAIYTAIASFIHPGDEVLVFEPAYDCYTPAIKLHGGLAKYISLKHPDYSIDWTEVRKAVTSHTKMIILNSPHNPTGSVLKEHDIQELQRLARHTDIIILSDEVYEHIIFDGKPHLSMAKYPDLAQRSLIISSFGKTFHTTGWKMGYCLAPAYLMKEFRKVHQFNVFSSNTPLQHACAEFLKTESNYLELPAFYQQKRDHFRKLLQKTPFKLLDCSGSYFQNVSFAHLTDESDVHFAKRLTQEYGVASIPNSAFYHHKTDHKTLRFCFAKTEETMQAAVQKLMKFS